MAAAVGQGLEEGRVGARVGLLAHQGPIEPQVDLLEDAVGQVGTTHVNLVSSSSSSETASSSAKRTLVAAEYNSRYRTK